VHVISFRPAEIPGVRVHFIDGLEALGKARYLVHAGRVRRLVHDLQPDLVHALHLTSYGFLAAYARVQPTITSVWGTDILEAPRWSPLHLYITRFALARPDHITATGLRLASATLEYAPRGMPVTVVPYGVDVERFRPAARSGRPESPVVVGSVGRLSPEKGLDVLLQAATRLSEAGTTLRVVIAGGGPERQRLERLAAQLRIDQLVELRGEVGHNDVPTTLSELDIFAMPSRAEGFGVAAVEAAAAGLPVVASNVHGIPDVVEHERTGLLVQPNNVAALAEAIRRLAANPDLRGELGRRGRLLVENRYRWEQSTALMERLYGHVLGAFADTAARATVVES
jgi:glycosyltransferase involved in cell wall biosynthesis